MNERELDLMQFEAETDVDQTLEKLMREYYGKRMEGTNVEQPVEGGNPAGAQPNKTGGAGPNAAQSAPGAIPAVDGTPI